MQYEAVPEVSPSSHEVLIKAEAFGVNFVDIMRRSGKHPAAPKPPFTPGFEVCGRVTAIGEGVSRFHEGDRVIGRCLSHAGYAEYVAVEERFAVDRPENVTPEEGAALFVTGQTGYHALVTMGDMTPGEWVLITAAAGGVGLTAVQIGKLLGAKVVAATGSAEKCELAESFGTNASVNYTEPDWPNHLQEAPGRMGADLIIESVSGEVASGCIAC